MAQSKAHQEASNRYTAKTYDRIVLLVSKGRRELIKSYAKKHDSSVNAFLLRAIRQTLQDDGADPETIRAICGD